MYTETTRRCVAVAGGWALRRALVAARGGAARGMALLHAHAHVMRMCMCMHMCMLGHVHAHVVMWGAVGLRRSPLASS